MLTKECLKKMNEARLSQRVLIPLLKAMGYQDVKYHHGGVSEQGKDITCWKTTLLDSRENLALVVKAVPISGKSAISNGTAGEVQMQVQQCFGRPFLDATTLSECHVHECWVISNKKISKEARGAITAALRPTGLDRSVQLIDGEKLWELVERYLPVRAVLQRLEQANKVLASLDTHYQPKITLSKSGIEIGLEEKFPGASNDKALTISATFAFPNTPEGYAKLHSVEEHFATGAPVDIPPRFIESVGLPEPFNELIGQGDPGKRLLRFGQVSSQRDLLVRINILCDDGDSLSLEYVHLKVVQQGTEQATLSNSHQPIPIQVTVLLNRLDRTGTFNFAFRGTDTTPNWILRSLRLRQCLAKRCLIRLVSLDTDLPVFVFHGGSTIDEPPKVNLVEYFEDLVAVQSKVNRAILFPSRQLTGDEERVIARLRAILRRGRLLGTWGELIVALRRQGVQKLLDNLEAKGDNRLVLEIAETEELFGSDMPLGRVRITVGARLGNEAEVRDALSNSRDEELPINCTFVPEGKDEFIKEYLDWQNAEI